MRERSKECKSKNNVVELKQAEPRQLEA